MASYETAAAEDGLLLETPKPKANSLKGLVAGAAIVSFVLGMLAATAVTQHAIATQTNLNAVGSVINAATSRPAGEESCGGQWGFALAFGRKDAKNQCPPGESAPPPPLSPSLSLSLPLSADTQSRHSFLVRRFPVRQNHQHVRVQQLL